MNPIKHIRKNVFGATQAEFAAIAGVQQPSVSRWENGVALTLDEMRNIRQAAFDRGIEWRDEWFFSAPVTEQEVAAA